MPFAATRITAPTLPSIRRAVPDYETMLVTVLDAILSRHERRPHYPFLDTKLDLITGEDFGDHPVKGRGVIYSWIQGRGLEALAGHGRWLPFCEALTPEEQQSRLARVSPLIRTVMDRMEILRARNDGHVFFAMTAEGQPLEFAENGLPTPTAVRADACNISDVFYSKGLFAAASWLGLDDKAEEAKLYFRRVVEDVAGERLYSDQQAFDPKNRVRPVPGRRSQGPWMLCLGGFALLAEVSGDDIWLVRAEDFIRRVNAHHINTGQFDGLQEYDFVEAIDTEGRPWRDERGVLSDSGHALEYLGLAAKCLLLMDGAAEKSRSRQALIDECRTLFPRVLVHNFRHAFNETAGGICKAFDLVARRPINSDMPWWSLPETIRAAMLCHELARSDEDRTACLDVLAKCSNAFLARFVNPTAHLMAYQTRDAAGNPVAVIPATPDADPGYHTGLSIIDFLNTLKRAG